MRLSFWMKRDVFLSAETKSFLRDDEFFSPRREVLPSAEREFVGLIDFFFLLEQN
jgi:hypothetical protein